MILSDRDIKGLLATGDLLVDPLHNDTIRENGLDLRLGSEYCRFRRGAKILDPKRPGNPEDYYNCGEGDEIIVNPGEHMLLHTQEYVGLPSFLAGLVNLRSTWARTGIYIPPTVVDAGFRGQIVIEVIGSSFPVKLYPGERFLHLVLVRLAAPSEKPYSGDYQGQTGVRLPKMFASNQLS